MALLISYEGADSEVWRQEFSKHLPDMDIRIYPEVGEPDDIEFAAVWMHPIGDLQRYTNLKAIMSFGAGVEHITRDPEFPRHVPIVRLVDGLVVQDMALHVVHWVLHFHRDYHRYLDGQKEASWQKYPLREPARRRVGFLGMGAMGAVAAKMVRNLGFGVSGWGRDPVNLEGVQFFDGDDELQPFLESTDILVNVLPLTAATENLLDERHLAMLPKGASVINISRGAIIVDEDLLAALDSGHLSAAALDTFRVEPLPVDHPFWTHPKVFVTPHVAGINYPHSAASLMADNIKKVVAGECPSPVFDPVRGY
ncbi:glyoxylate/hydroxypyruvate reductase A [uncultured Oceanisphaera sp.]|uniref:2-hydroxyacid dehydrogenase n=1 Tax=uncultured Oceanisphaera sp. TaxID=353858 RepID=UPI002608D12D|nr:glyoxylate/hydroxypyruvate reductase A [uncultured Oceanisphaera sp.]